MIRSQERAGDPQMKRRPSKRKVLSYLLCVLIAAGGLALALRLSFPPDPDARRYIAAPPDRESPQLEADRSTLQVKSGKQTTRYRLYQTDKGIVAHEVTDEQASDKR